MALCVEVPGKTERDLPAEPAQGEALAVTWPNTRLVRWVFYDVLWCSEILFQDVWGATRCLISHYIHYLPFTFHFIASILGISF